MRLEFCDSGIRPRVEHKKSPPSAGTKVGYKLLVRELVEPHCSINTHANRVKTSSCAPLASIDIGDDEM